MVTTSTMCTLTFNEAIKHSTRCQKRHLLLGNGFSIACRPTIFTYGSLFQQADFSSSVRLQSVFKAAHTEDFEYVIKLLEDGSRVVPVYLPSASDMAAKMANNARLLRDILIRTVANNHPNVPNDISHSQFFSCRRFLKHFLDPNCGGKVYTLNYDLLLYWTLLHVELDGYDRAIELVTDDGFSRNDETPEEYVDWMGESSARVQRVHYLHGALHLFDSGAQIRKFTWKNTDLRLLDQARAAMNIGQFPLFVAEGTSDQKLAKIKHSAYLYHSYKSFSEQMKQRNGALFVFGHSLADNDRHIMIKIAQGRLSHLYVGIYGDKRSEENRRIMSSAEALGNERTTDPLNVVFYDTGSAGVWESS